MRNRGRLQKNSSGFSKNASTIFVRSGIVGVGNGYLRVAGIAGHYWSRSSSAATTAYDLNFNASGVYPSNGPGNRYTGFSLRCLQE